MSFSEILAGTSIKELAERVEAKTERDVATALASEEVGFEEFLSLLSPAAELHLEPLAARAQRITRQRFGRTVSLYTPLYVSNECNNKCLYCGFNRDNEIKRTTLSMEEARLEAELLWSQGFRHLLLVSGEAPRTVPVEYFVELAKKLSTSFPSVSVEIYPLSEKDYRRLVEAGVDGLTVYQETYDRDLYAQVHPGGKKSDFDNRLAAPERGAAAGMRRVGIGALLGLGPWRGEVSVVGLHGLYLQKQFWRTQTCISFPRLRKAPGGFTPKHPVSDHQLVQLSSALRLLLPDTVLILSTREYATFRDGMARICITSMSAGSSTEPGGYSKPGESDGQFEVADHRSAAEVAAMLDRAGLDPVWKDWDEGLSPSRRR